MEEKELKYLQRKKKKMYERQTRYGKKHFTVLSTKLRNKKAITFKGLCYEKRKSVNRVLREYVDACIMSGHVISVEV